MDDVLLNKSATIDRCLKRVKEEYLGHEDELELNFTQQDSIILNIQRACQAAIDMGSRAIRLQQLPSPQQSRDIFDALAENGNISKPISQTMKKMIGFRNIAVHEYQSMDIAILRSVIEKHLPEIREYANQLLVD